MLEDEPPKTLKPLQRNVAEINTIMHFSTTLSFFLAALVAAAPSYNNQGNVDTQKRGLVTFIMTEPNCPALKNYCTHCNDDFNCETDPRCEWCYRYKQFGNGNEDDD
ncbi:hypothetical protein E0Z10_g4433 [Xylaria hypoxylon]|uniref:Uncharacterized protein n=1 Tax=Xylaria hypoxylon TaxID=37992 RepID=A0A4Z0YJ63_9PEZI|nr:hypothetical protein E0Z10_g4433 [Xylaria hypoxylon]